MSWFKNRFHGFLDNLTYDLFARYVIPLAIGSIWPVGYWLLAKFAHIHWDRWTSNFLILAAIITAVMVGRYLKRKWPSVTVEMQREMQQRHQEALASIDYDRADRNAETIERRMTEVQEQVEANLPLIAMMDRLQIDATREHLAAIGDSPKSIEPVEQNLIEQAFAIDQETNWPEFRKMGIAVRVLNSSIDKHNELADERLCHRLLKEVEIVRKHIVVIQRERLQRS